MIEISDQNYRDLIEARNAFGKELNDLADVAEALVRKGDASVPEHLRGVTEKDLVDAVGMTRSLVHKYGEHQAFVLV